VKDSWLRLWFLNRSQKRVKEHSLETGSIRLFIEGMTRSLQAISDCLDRHGRLVMVCGRAGKKAGREKDDIRISDLCIYAVHKEMRSIWAVEDLLHDRKMMKRGSYFAVHRGKRDSKNGKQVKRFGEEEILILRKR
jgi:hypothetical protein